MNRRTALPVLVGALALDTASTGTAVAGHAAFSDAAGTHQAGIHWLAESGVTGGCGGGGGGRFCTEDAVKRGQMATFLHRLSGKGGIPPVVADKVDGLNAEQLRGQKGPAGPAGPPGPAPGVVYPSKKITVNENPYSGSDVLLCPSGTKPVNLHVEEETGSTWAVGILNAQRTGFDVEIDRYETDENDEFTSGSGSVTVTAICVG